MFRFDRLIRRGMVTRDVKRIYPPSIPVSLQFHFRPPCNDRDIETVARKSGLNTQDVLMALNQAAFGPKADTKDASD
jgi:hypothetical protein